MRRAWGEPADYRLPDHLVIHRQDPYTAFWSDVNPPAYSPGTLVGRWSKSGTQVCPGNTIMAQSTLTRLTFIAADGTETELVDELTGGTPKSDNTCSSPDPNQTCSVAALCRGTVFVARDGSAMRFVADAGISDTTVLTWDQFTVAGTLYFRNGIRYKIDSYGRVRIITDRNGNQVNLDYDEDGDLIHVRDSANRDITIAHSLSVDTITYPGRPDIRINKSAISSALDSNRTCVLPTCEMPSPMIFLVHMVAAALP
jgi:YD repeat-containing protein